MKNKLIIADLIQKLLAALIVVYLILFAVETVTVGLIMNIINLNLLLLVIFILLGALFLIGETDKEAKFIKNNRWAKLFFYSFLIILGLFLAVVLFEVSLIETGFYILVLFWCGGLFYSLIR